MRKRVFLAGLLLFLQACAHGPAQEKLSKARAYIPSFRPPVSITADNYKSEREIYDALPEHTPGRSQFRGLLLGHLLKGFDEAQRRGDEAAALKAFVAAITLFHPNEIFLGRIRDGRLALAAARLAQHYSPRGDEEHVLLPLCVQLTVGGDDRALQAKVQEIMRWVDEAQQLVHGPGARGALLVRVLERIARSWPSTFVVERLRALYLERRIVLARTMSGESYRHLRLALPALLQGAAFQTGYRIARLYLRVDRAYEALSKIRQLAGGSEGEGELRQLLEHAVSPTANVRDQVRLAEHFEERDREVSLRVCEAAAERFPDHAAAYECLGRFAAATDRPYLAVTALERAVQIAPDQLSYAEALARNYQRRLFDLIGEDQLDEAERQTLRIEALYRRTEQRFRTPLKPSLARVYYAIGHGYFNAGRLAKAIAAFERSVASELTPDALTQLAMIRLKKDDARGALAHLERAEAIVSGSPAERLFWRARLHGLRGRAMELVGNTEASRREHAVSIEAWQQWQGVGLQPEAQAEASIYQAQSLYALGRKSHAIDALERAIDIQPDRKETYADVIAMLITHGHLPEALDALHRALGRAEVSEYLKTYCSLWVVGLAKRASLPPDGLALQHLTNLSGSSWYVRLAQMTLGKASYEELLKHAQTAGNKAELYYYWADHLVSQGKLGQARELWQKVLDTEMLGFYEYEMSFFNLRNGAATVNTRPLDRSPAH